MGDSREQLEHLTTKKQHRPLTTTEKWAAHLLVCSGCAAMDRLSKDKKTTLPKSESSL